jgi:phosphomevalonate kinase
VIARAPGKVVLSGAYAVLEGAPSVVTAVDRYVVADSSRPAGFLTPEVKAALGNRPAPWFDATALRAGDKKLGVGSSAAILVASLGAVYAEERGIRDEHALRTAVLEPALAAHRAAQGGGSGVDVAASTWGGTLVARRSEGGLALRPVVMPPGLHVEVLFAGVPASTSELVGRVRALATRDPGGYAAVIARLSRAAEDAERAFDGGSAAGVLAALAGQLEGLAELGRLASAPIVTPEVERMARAAAREGAVVLPAGAGGGDIAVFAALHEPSEALAREFDAERHVRLDLRLSARGLHLADERAAGGERDR